MNATICKSKQKMQANLVQYDDKKNLTFEMVVHW
jgi:hypothetical protein